MRNVFNIAVDGPAGAGKSTIARSVAAKLHFVYVDTGAMYRAMALHFLRNGIKASDEAAVSRAAGEVKVSISYRDGEQQVILNGEDVSGLIRTEEVSAMASAVSVYMPVRKKLVELQKELALKENVIMDGRDIGTCVLPDADLKIYLTASSQVRARRRYEELKAKGAECSLEDIEKDIIERDHRDMNREISPLRQAEDAIRLDTSDMTIEEVVERILELFMEKNTKQEAGMEVIVAKTAGFCFGVKRAVDQVYEQLKRKDKPIYTYGPIIHNEEVVRDLEEKGVKVIETEEELSDIRDAVVVIRSHGVGKHIYDIMEKNGIEIVDATCPFVKKIHKIAEEQNETGRRLIIIGNEKHPEVEGIKGWGNDNTLVVETPEQVETLPLMEGEKLCIVSQTTFNYNKFQDLVEKISETRYDILVLNTICNATQERQVEARRIASEVDAMIVIGGKSSSNTQKLYEICRRECKNTYYIQTLGDLDSDCVNSVRSVGITAGASTPNNIIEEVHTNVRVKF